MKKILFTFLYLFIGILMNAQTYTFTGGGDGSSWTDPANWDKNAVPFYGTNDDNLVIIPEGKNAIISASENIRMKRGVLYGPGTVTNNGIFTLLSTGDNKSFSTNLKFINQGTMNFGEGTRIGQLGVSDSNIIIDNKEGGKVHFNGVDVVSATYPGAAIFYNRGLIKKIGNFLCTHQMALEQTGAIQVDAGELTLNCAHINGGTYNVSANSTLKLNGYRSYTTLNGNLTGSIDGTFIIYDGMTKVLGGAVMTNNLNGNGIEFTRGYISGPGKIINNTKFNLYQGDAKWFEGGLTFENNGNLILGNGTLGGRLSVRQGNIIDNKAGGTVHFNGMEIMSADYPGDPVFYNKGLIKKTGDFSSVHQMVLEQTGSIQVDAGELSLYYVHINGGLYNVSANAILKVNGSSSYTTLNGNLTGSIDGKFLIYDGMTKVLGGSVMTNNLNGNGIEFTRGFISGPGKIINNTKFNLYQGDAKWFEGGLTFENNGNLILGNGTLGGRLSVRQGNIIDNKTGGTVHFNGMELMSSEYPGDSVFYNKGLIKKTGDFSSVHQMALEQTGSIQVDAGELSLNYAHINGGTYTIANAATLKCSGYNSYQTLQGSLEGTVNGKFLIYDGTSTVPEAKTLTNNLQGNGIHFTRGNIVGPGTFINNTLLAIYQGDNKSFKNGLQFINNHQVVFGDESIPINMYLGDDMQFTNSETGEVRLLKSYFGQTGSIENSKFINKGIVKKLLTDDLNYSSIPFYNKGILELADGEMYFNALLVNENDGLIRGKKLYLNANKFENYGRVNPGIGIGKMEVRRVFSMGGGVLEFEISGKTPETEYDVLQYTDIYTVQLSGGIEVLLGFEPAIGDGFTVVNAPSGAINATLPEFVWASYGGKQYKFKVEATQKQVVLQMVEKSLGTEDALASKLKIYPNPVQDILYFEGLENLSQVEIFGVDGRKYRSEAVSGKKAQIDVKPLATGIYILKIKTDKAVVTKKLIKK